MTFWHGGRREATQLTGQFGSLLLDLDGDYTLHNFTLDVGDIEGL